MILARILKVANPYSALAGMILLVSALVATISITSFDRQWIVFLCGVLAAATLAFVSHTANSRWIIARRTAQLSMTRAKLVSETRLRAHAEETLARISNNVDLVDTALPAMLAYVDRERRVRYHNHAYARWVGLQRKAIDGGRLEDVVGREAFTQLDPHFEEALQGRDVRYERSQTRRNGETCQLSVQYLPHFDDKGTVAGVFAILTDITRAEDLGVVESHDGEAVHCDVGLRLISALDRDEFSLHCQAIVPLGNGAPEAAFREVLLRMNEEEAKQLPPGTFLPLAEELGLLHEIDRWVVRNVVDFAADTRSRQGAVYFVNLSRPTILDPTFANFVRECLKSRRVPDHTLCFEFAEADVVADPGAYRGFIAALDGTGCRFAVSGFGSNPLSMRFLDQLRVDFLKIDGGIVFNMLRSAAGLARVKAINQAAHAAGMRTVAECVENDCTRAALARIGVDFAQGFGIAKPRPIRAPDVDPAPLLGLERAAA
jgi:PAS domain S-box-containing protein